MLSLLSSWAAALSLIFGGCCSNAITLERLTLEYPNVGSVLTLFQFLLISLHGLPKFLVWTRFGPRFRPRRVPITYYLIQVALFYFVSLLNNAAFAYRIPMAVHIIFRSGGLIVNLLLGWLISKKRYVFSLITMRELIRSRYTSTQVTSVLLVTAGVVITTLSAQSSSAKKSTSVATYATGIGILTLALVLSGMLGLVQDWTFAKHALVKVEGPAPWQESMFYLHFLALPMFIPLLPDLAAQMHILNSQGSRVELNFPVPLPALLNFSTTFPALFPSYSPPSLPIHLFPRSGNMSLLSITEATNLNSTPFSYHPFLLSLSIPHVYLPLVLNTITQLLCAAGVHRLTTHVSALTVTLVLVVRKAASLIISVIGVSQVVLALKDLLTIRDREWSFFGIDLNALFRALGTVFAGSREAKRPQEVDNRMMWTGAALVLLGTIGYTIGSRPKQVNSQRKGKTE